jgi:phosphoribosylaminoimidazolecarboxamide formyltransferase/IMP cyclohydrolase
LYPNECIVDVIKHTNPTGVTRSDDPTKSLLISWETDPTSAYGGIICSSNYVDESFAQGLVDKYIELLIAPGFTGGAMDILRKKGDLRVMRIEGFDKPLLDDGYDYKKVRGGLLVQERNISRIRGPENLETVSERYPISDEQEAGPFLWRIAKNTKSNAIVVGYKDRVLGVGEGQPNRYDSAYIAIKLRRDKYTQAKDGILASDAFFPYPDTVKLAGESGITAIIFPLGSIRDQEAIDMGNKYNMAMMVTRPIPGDKKTIERGFFH